MNEHYDSILNWKDKRFKTIFNKVTVNNKSDREDLRQEFIFKLLKYEKSFKELKGDDIYFYSISVLKRLVASYNKHKTFIDYETEYEPQIEYDFIKKTEVDRLKDFIDKLPFYERELIKLYYYEDSTYRDISDLTLIPITSLNTSIKKIIEKIKKYYGINNNN